MEQLLVSDMIFNLEKHFAVKVQGDEVKKSCFISKDSFACSALLVHPRNIETKAPGLNALVRSPYAWFTALYSWINRKKEKNRRKLRKGNFIISTRHWNALYSWLVFLE